MRTRRASSSGAATRGITALLPADDPAVRRLPAEHFVQYCRISAAPDPPPPVPGVLPQVFTQPTAESMNEDLWNAQMHGNMDIGPDSDAEGATATKTHTDESE